jgi:hypothetical protein
MPFSRSGFLHGYLHKEGVDRPSAARSDFFRGGLTKLQRSLRKGTEMARNAAAKASVVTPESSFQRYAPWPAKGLVRSGQAGLGRVVTNTMVPTGYSVSGHLSEKPTVEEVLRAFFLDQPTKRVRESTTAVNRNTQFRMGFGLDPNLSGWGKELAVSPGSGTGKAGQSPAVLEPRWRSPDVQQTYRTALETGDGSPLPPGTVWTPWAGHTAVRKGKVVEDPFDYRLSPGERLDSSNNWARLLVSPFVNPAKIRMRHPEDVLTSPEKSQVAAR